MSDSMSSGRLEAFIVDFLHVRTFNYISVALLAVMVYDTLLTMRREVNLIWKGSISLGKVLYIFTRYYALISIIAIVKVSLDWDLSLNNCRLYINWFDSSGLQLEEAAVNMLLILRINALYEGQKKIFYPLLIIYLAEVVILISVGAKAASIVPLALLPPGLSAPGCYSFVSAAVSYEFTLIGWVPALILSAILLGLSAYKIRDDIAFEAPKFWNYKSWNSHHPLLLAIIQQGMIFYILNTSITLINAAVIVRIHNILDTVAIPLGIVAYSICGCRFLLNFYELSNDGLAQAQLTNGAIFFEDNTGDSLQLNTL